MAKGFVPNTGLGFRGGDMINGHRALRLVRTQGSDEFCTGIQAYWDNRVWRLVGVEGSPAFELREDMEEFLKKEMRKRRKERVN